MSPRMPMALIFVALAAVACTSDSTPAAPAAYELALVSRRAPRSARPATGHRLRSAAHARGLTRGVRRSSRRHVDAVRRRARRSRLAATAPAGRRRQRIPTLVVRRRARLLHRDTQRRASAVRAARGWHGRTGAHRLAGACTRGVDAERSPAEFHHAAERRLRDFRLGRVRPHRDTDHAARRLAATQQPLLARRPLARLRVERDRRLRGLGRARAGGWRTAPGDAGWRRASALVFGRCEKSCSTATPSSSACA